MKNNLIKQIVLFCSFCYGLNAEIITPNKAYEMATNTSHKLKSNHYNMLSKRRQSINIMLDYIQKLVLRLTIMK